VAPADRQHGSSGRWCEQDDSERHSVRDSPRDCAAAGPHNPSSFPKRGPVRHWATTLSRMIFPRGAAQCRGGTSELPLAAEVTDEANVSIVSLERT
jgi:hypothetical protein